MNTLERKLDKRSKKDSEDNAIVGKRIRVAKRLWEDEDEDDPPTAVATVSGTKVSFLFNVLTLYPIMIYIYNYGNNLYV